MSIRYLSGINVDSNTLFVDSANDRVGIGTGSPTAKLQLYGSGLIDLNVTSTNNQALLYLQGTFGQVENNVGDFYITNSAPSSPMIFRTATTERMRITSAGNVGIGTTSPNNKLSVVGNIEIQSGGSKIGFNVNDAFAGYGTSIAHYGISYAFTANPLALSGYFGIGIFTEGAERMRVLGNGNVGIGTTSPQVKLEVRGAQDNTIVPANAVAKFVGGDAGIFVGNLAGTPNYGAWLQAMRESDGLVFPLHLQPNGGNVGIGTTSPLSKLQVRAGLDQNFRVASSTNLTVASINDADSAYAPITFRASTFDFQNGNVGIGTTAPGAKLEVSGNWKLGDISGGSFKSYTFGTELDISGLISGGWARSHKITTSDTSGNVFFGVLGNNTTLTRAYWTIGDPSSIDSTGYNSGNGIILLKNGNVGIGTTAPGYKLEVKGSDTGNWLGVVYNTAATDGQAFLARIGGNSQYGYLGAYRDGFGYDFFIRGDGTGYFAGNVGIGTAAPSQKLDVNGYSRATSGFVGSTTLKLFGDNSSTEFVAVNTNGSVQMTSYGGGSITGTVAYNLAVDSSGNIIETAGGVVDGSGTANYVSKWQDANTLTDSVIYDNGTNVGIGESSPSYKLHVGGTLRASGDSSIGGNVIIGGTAAPSTTWTGVGRLAVVSDVYSGVNLTTANNTLGNYTILALGKSRGTIASPTAVADNEPLSSILFYGHDGTNYIANASITATLSGSVSTGNVPTILQFATGTTGATERMRITSAGNVGIGTTSPSTALDVVGTITAYRYQAISSSASLVGYGVGTGLGMFNAGTDTLGFATASTERMRITSGGNVGIGTTSPSASLDVKGVSDTSGAISLQLRSGNTSGNFDSNQITLSYNNTSLYRHAIKTRHNSGSSSGNAIDFYTWQYGGLDSAIGGQHVMSLDGANVGVGITSPTATLHVVGTHKHFANIGAGTNLVRVDQYGTDTNYRLDYKQIVSSSLVKHSYNIVNNGTSYDNNLVLDRGNVGIGTDSPGYKLDVQGAGGITISTNGAIIAGTELITGSGILAASSSGTDVAIKAGASTLMTLKSGGNVGIGTTSPAEKLHVEGTTDVNILVRTSGASGNAYTTYENSGDNTFAWAIGRHNAGGFYFNSSTGGTYPSGTTTTRMVIDTSGNVGIGTTSPSYKLHTVGDAYFTSFTGVGATPSSSWSLVVDALAGTDGAIKTTGSVLINTGALGVNVTPSATAGRIDASNDIVAYSTSDQRLKENITPIANALDKVKALTGVEFDWKEETKDVHGYEGHDVGVIAQEVQAVLPEAVRTNDSGYLSVRYEKMIALLVEANKELAARVELLESKLKQ